MFQPKLAVLADLQPLKVGNDAKQVISLPVGDRQPADGLSPAVGRFLLCNEHGAILNHKPSMCCTGIEVEFEPHLEPLTMGTYTFTNDVRFVLFWTDNMNPGFFEWYSNDESIMLQELFGGTRYILNKSGPVFKIKNAHDVLMGTFKLYGFY